MIVNDIGLTKDSYSNIYTADGSEIGTIYDREGHIIYYMYRDTIGDGSRVFTSYGAPIKDCKIYGETLQDGTPSPDMPVDVVGCGVRTENLYNGAIGIDNARYSGTYPGACAYDTRYEISELIPVLPNTDYTLSWDHVKETNRSSYMIAYYNLSGTDCIGMIGLRYYTTDLHYSITVNTPTNCGFVRLQRKKQFDFNMMFNAGQEALPYDPYGYKLPETITNGTDTVTTPIYIGSEPLHRFDIYADYADYSHGKTTRRVNKLVLTGDESWTTYGGSFISVIVTDALRVYNVTTVRCSHYLGVPTANGSSIARYNLSVNFSITTRGLLITDRRFNYNIKAFTDYLAAQYAAGTPVTVWYVLETPIEEDPPVPFPELPTLTGTNTLSIDTPVKPSEIDLTGRFKTSGYGQLLDKNLTAINDSTGTPIFIRG